MASLVIQFVEKTDNRNLNPPLAGRNVAAWPVSDFVQTPADGKYPTTQSPAATGTTDSGGNCTLTGLTSSALYYVSIVDAGTMPHWTQPIVAGTGINNKLTYVPSPYSPSSVPATSTGLVFAAYIGSTLSVGGNVAMPFSNIVYDPLSASDGFGFKVPASLAGENLYAECSLTYGGTTAGGSGIAADLNVSLKQNASLLNTSWFDAPLGSVSLDRTVSLAGTAIAVVTDDLIYVYTGTSGNGSLSWGSINHFYTQMRVFTA